MTLPATEAQADFASLKQLAIECGAIVYNSCLAMSLSSEASDVQDASLGMANNLQHLEDIVETVADLDPDGPEGETYPTVPSDLSGVPFERQPFFKAMKMLEYMQQQLPKFEELTITYSISTESQLDGETEYDDHYADAAVKLGDLATLIGAQYDVLKPYMQKAGITIEDLPH